MDLLFKTIIALGGAMASFLFGGWSMLLSILLAFVIIDYVSGVVAAALDGKLNSEVGLRGIAKKVSIFAVVAVAHLVDVALGGQATLFRDVAIFFYIANEGISILENVGRIGVPVPKKLKGAIEKLREGGEQK
nr:phage holin family protein [Caldalkalibacillus thermarum]